MSPVRVAVVIPMRNGAGEIGACLDAVFGQTVPADEVIVVDNGSTDGSAAEAVAVGARVIFESTPGSYRARNAGIGATTADIVAFTDADCVPDPDWLAHLVAGFEDPSVGAVGGEIRALEVRSPAQRWAVERHVLDQATAFAHPFLPYFATANVAYRRAALDAIGGFDAALTSGGDVDAAWRLQDATAFRLVFEPGAIVRHRHRRRVSTLVRQHRRYARGHADLDQRWGSRPAYRRSVGSPSQRLRAVWLLPARLPYRAVRRQSLRLPLIDAAIRLAHEVGRWEGHRNVGGSTDVLSTPEQIRGAV
jgi:cellulose synthase/poly-beta-1,6-N-acetylglucosamine synthase-like glycosyltransferase